MSARWYVMHVYSGFEDKVSDSIWEKARKQGLEDHIEQIMVPTEEVVEVKRGQRVQNERKFFPGYVLIKVDLQDEVWHMIKNTPKVTGFLGSGNKPSPMSESEAQAIVQQVEEGTGSPSAVRRRSSWNMPRSRRRNRAYSAASPSSPPPVLRINLRDV